MQRCESSCELEGNTHWRKNDYLEMKCEIRRTLNQNSNFVLPLQSGLIQFFFFCCMPVLVGFSLSPSLSLSSQSFAVEIRNKSIHGSFQMDVVLFYRLMHHLSHPNRIAFPFQSLSDNCFLCFDWLSNRCNILMLIFVLFCLVGQTNGDNI